MVASQGDPIASRSPWLEQLDADSLPRPLDHNDSTDVVIVGAGIAGVATAFFTLRDSSAKVVLIERDRVGRGATGHNAGQLATYFERPLCDLVDAYGFDAAIDAQRAFDGADDLLDEMIAEAGVSARVERVVGHMGMFSLNHLLVHLRNGLLRQQGGLRVDACVISQDAEFLAEIPAEFADLYSVVPQAQVQEMLCTTDHRYRAILSSPRGCANSALIVQQVLSFLEAEYADRFTYADHTPVERIVVSDDGATVHAAGHEVVARNVVLCTNGFVDHLIEDATGASLDPPAVRRTVGYMAAYVEPSPRPANVMSYIRNETIGGDTPYVYATRRTFDSRRGPSTLTCFGGPEQVIATDAAYDVDDPFPSLTLEEIDSDIRPIVDSARESGAAYDYAWHGLMAYTENKVRVIGFDAHNRALLYNLGCNGVGFLQSVYGGHRIARLIGGERLPPSIFDPA
ncbi:MAG TPA: FAD-binding oxidoreductase [Ilumatobacteraceae bacterium]